MFSPQLQLKPNQKLSLDHHDLAIVPWLRWHCLWPLTNHSAVFHRATCTTVAGDTDQVGGAAAAAATPNNNNQAHNATPRSQCLLLAAVHLFDITRVVCHTPFTSTGGESSPS